MAFAAIGFIGVGVMGEPICRHLATKSGLPVFANDNNPEPLRRLASHGVKEASISEITQSADIIFMSLPSGEIMEQVVLGREGNGLIDLGRKEQVIVDLSTSAVSITKKVAQALQEKGMAFVDAPVMRTRMAAEEGTLAVPIGATEELFKQVESFIRMFASDVHHVGENGAGQVVKILNNMVLYETVLALAEARAIGARAGVEPQKLFEAMSVGSADSFALRNHGFKAIVPQLFPEKTFPVSYARKDVQYAVDLATELGIDATGAKNLVACFDKAIKSGHGDKYAPAINLVFETS